jgi:hypothetical protein
MTPFAAETRSPTEKPTVYRAAAALIGGVLVLLFCGIGAIDLIIEDGTQDLLGASILLLVAVLSGLYGVYPAAFSWPNRLVVRNPFRTIELPWDTVTDLSARLSFIAHTEARRFTVWAIPVSLRERRRAERHRLRDLSQAQRAVKRGVAPELFQPSRARRPEPIDRMSFADQAIEEMNARREAYTVQVRLRAKQAEAAAAAAAAASAVEDHAVEDRAVGEQAAADSTASDQAATRDAVAQLPVEQQSAPVDAATVRWAWPTISVLGASVALLIVAIIVR